MKKYFFLFGIALLSVAFIHPSKKAFIPPGTVKICDTLYFDEAEVTNCSWQEFENWTKVKYGANSNEHISTLPDTLVWRQNNSSNEPYVQYYYRHPAYKDYPVIGISYVQAIAYCKWRTERVMENVCLSKKYSALNFEYRLPTKQEWEFASNNGTGYFNNRGLNEKEKITSNHRWAKDDYEARKGYQHAYPEVLAPVTSYEKNLFGIYNMIGNAAEMVYEKGISKGGSWCHLLEQCRVGKEITYEKPSAWLGFRCVCVMKQPSKNS